MPLPLRSPHGSADGIRLGSDIVRIADVADALQTFGDRYLRRVFTPHEIATCRTAAATMPSRLAARFAAKEACVKVLRPVHRWFDWRSIEVVKTSGGWCELRLHGAALRAARRQGVVSLAVSLSHDGAYAQSVVAATLRPTVRPRPLRPRAHSPGRIR
ncbi:holo-ACP synthase [uncultured Xylophilus sp.]|uniref:holo-ACP synthase n=1 Tax=uncultured Xylophilus sp. TaxID=296832 RepID=UPI0025E883AE|nr:holo-ACP synthase [uncultured Xylophilus sp.]